MNAAEQETAMWCHRAIKVNLTLLVLVLLPATASATRTTSTEPHDQHAVAVRVYGGNRKPLPHSSHHIETIQRAARPGSTNDNYVRLHSSV